MALRFKNRYSGKEGSVSDVIESALRYCERGELEDLRHKVDVLSTLLSRVVENLSPEVQRKVIEGYCYELEEIESE